MHLEGDLRDFRIGQLVNLIHLTQTTGALVIHQAVIIEAERHTPLPFPFTSQSEIIRAKVIAGEERVRIYFNKGDLVDICLSNEDNRLDTILYKAGKLTNDQLASLNKNDESATDKYLMTVFVNNDFLS